MAFFCLPKSTAQELLNRIKNGKINIDKLGKMTNAELRESFEEFMDTPMAQATNALLEQKLQQKNYWNGVRGWIEQVTGNKPAVRTDMLSKVTRAEKAGLLTPKDQAAFLEDLVAQKLGTKVTIDQAQKLVELTKEIETSRGAVDVIDAAEKKYKENPTKENLDAWEKLKANGDEYQYGAAIQTFKKYTDELKHPPTISELGVKQTILDWINHPLKTLNELAGAAKSGAASLDNSGLLRQGWKLLWTQPSIWWKNSLKSFSDIATTLKEKKSSNTVVDVGMAEIFSRPNYRNGNYEKGKVALGILEESFPTTFLEKTPFLGRLYKASQDAFTMFFRRNRADIFDRLLEKAEKDGFEITPERIQNIGMLTNIMTSRGSLGKLEPAAQYINNPFFSPRNFKANFDTLTASLFNPQMRQDPFVRKQAATNLLKIISGTATVLVIARAMNPDSVTGETTSSDFGKIKVGNTRYDMTGGMGSMLVLVERLIQRKVTSSTTGKARELGAKFGDTQPMELVYDFMENKLAPGYTIAEDIINGSDRLGRPITLGGELWKTTPLILQTTYESLKDPNSAPVLLNIIMDGLGISTSTYSAQSLNSSKLKKSFSSPSQKYPNIIKSLK